MVVAVNTRLLLSGKMEGIGWFTHEILQRITKSHPNVEFHFFFDRPFDVAFVYSTNVTAHVLSPPTRHPWLIDWWFNWAIPRRLKRIKADIFVSMDGFCSLRTKVPQIITIHDINFVHFPEQVHARYRTYLPRRTKAFVKKAIAITTVSEFSANDIRKTFQADKLIHVIPNAASNLFKPMSEVEIENIRSRFTQGRPYFLFVSSIHPRKNLERILQAYVASRSNGEHQLPMVVVGRRFWMNEGLDRYMANMPFQDDIIFTGNLDQLTLSKVTGAAHALVYASLYEGFGIPIVEAMQCGVPVITSNVTSMPEVAQGAALLVDPLRVEEIAEAFKKIATDNALCQQLSEAGLVRAKAFDWSNSAALFWRVIQDTVQTSSSPS